MLFLMDENSCFQCFCTEKYEKCVRPDKNLSLKAALQGRENKIKRLLCRNQATVLPSLGVRHIISTNPVRSSGCSHISHRISGAVL